MGRLLDGCIGRFSTLYDCKCAIKCIPTSRFSGYGTLICIYSTTLHRAREVQGLSDRDEPIYLNNAVSAKVTKYRRIPILRFRLGIWRISGSRRARVFCRLVSKRQPINRLAFVAG